MSERGNSESLQWTLLVPLLLSLCLGLIQTGIWLYGRSVAADAAHVVAQEVAWERRGESEARAVGERIAFAGGLTVTDVSVERSATEVRVRLAAHVPTFFDVGQGAITEVAVVPVEEVREP